MLKTLIGPMLIMIIIGVVGMAIAAFVIAKIFKMSFPLALANGLTALYGFPCDAIITESTCNSLTEDPDERGYLMSKMFPSMVVGVPRRRIEALQGGRRQQRRRRKKSES